MRRVVLVPNTTPREPPPPKVAHTVPPPPSRSSTAGGGRAAHAVQPSPSVLSAPPTTFFGGQRDITNSGPTLVITELTRAAPFSVISEVPSIQHVKEPLSYTPMLFEVTPQSLPAAATTTNYAPGADNFPTAGKSYFALASDVVPLTDWSLYPAVSNIDVSGYDISGAQNISTVTLEVNGQLYVPTDQWYTFPTLPIPPATGGVVKFVDASGEHTLASIDGNLYYDNELLAKASDIQDVADWALYPALQDVDMDNHALNNVTSIDLSGVTLTGLGTKLLVNGNAVALESDLLDVSSALVDLSGRVADLSGTVADLSGTVADLSGFVYGLSGEVSDISDRVYILEQEVIDVSANIANWSLYPAVSDVSMNSHNIKSTSNMVVEATASTLTATGNIVNVTGDGGLAGSGSVNISAGGGLAPQVNITGNTSAAGVPAGKVYITANGGSVDSVAYGGLIELDANSGPGLYSATSAIKMNAAGINLYAGAIPSIASLAGYSFEYGTLGINKCVGLPSLIPNVPGTMYLYAVNGIEMGSDLYVSNLYPYWNTVDITPDDLVIQGRSFPTSAYVQLLDVRNIDMASTAAINNVSTINGAPVVTLADISAAVTPVFNYAQDLSGTVADLSGFVYGLSGEVSTLSATLTDLSGVVADLSGVVYDLSGVVADVSANILNWSTYPAVSDVDMSGNDISGATLITSVNMLATSSLQTPQVHIDGSSGIYLINTQPNILDVTDSSLTTRKQVRVSALNLNDASGDTVLFRQIGGRIGATDLTTTNTVAYLSDIPTTAILPAAAFSSNTNQTVTAADTPTIISHNTTDYNSGEFHLDGSGNIVVDVSGTFEIIPSIQFNKTGGGTSLGYFWLRVNTTDVSDSTTEIVIIGPNAATVGTVAFVQTLAVGDVVKIVMASADATWQADANVAQTSPYARPANPSIITTIKRLSADLTGSLMTSLLTAPTPPTGITMTQIRQFVSASTANIQMATQTLGPVSGDLYSVAGHSLTQNGTITQTGLAYPRVYTWNDGVNWYLDASVTNCSSSATEQWVINVTRMPGTSTNAIAVP